MPFSPDARLLVTSCKDGNVHLWENASGKRLQTWNMTATTMWFGLDAGRFNQRRVLACAGLARVGIHFEYASLRSPPTLCLNSAEYDPAGADLTASPSAGLNANNGVQQPPSAR
jgi:hypothetical protein